MLTISSIKPHKALHLFMVFVMLLLPLQGLAVNEIGTDISDTSMDMPCHTPDQEPAQHDCCSDPAGCSHCFISMGLYSNPSFSYDLPGSLAYQPLVSRYLPYAGDTPYKPPRS